MKQNRNGFDGPLQTVLQDAMAAWFADDQMSAAEMSERFLAPDFSAELDGHILTRRAFEDRIDRMRKDANVEGQDFVEMMEEDDRVFSMHIVRGQSLASGHPFETRVIALFIFESEKIKKVYLNSVTLGDPRDADFASRG
ncbi:MAG: nuclear transport factor 2 family protein [Pseudomonadota bacterium]